MWAGGWGTPSAGHFEARGLPPASRGSPGWGARGRPGEWLRPFCHNPQLSQCPRDTGAQGRGQAQPHGHMKGPQEKQAASCRGHPPPGPPPSGAPTRTSWGHSAQLPHSPPHTGRVPRKAPDAESDPPPPKKESQKSSPETTPHTQGGSEDQVKSRFQRRGLSVQAGALGLTPRVGPCRPPWRGRCPKAPGEAPTWCCLHACRLSVPIDVGNERRETSA